VGMTLEMLY